MDDLTFPRQTGPKVLCTKQDLSKLIHILNTLAEVPGLAILIRSSLQSKEADCGDSTVFCKEFVCVLYKGPNFSLEPISSGIWVTGRLV